MPKHIVRMVSECGFVLPHGHAIQCLELPGRTGPVDITIRTEYVDKGYSTAVAEHLAMDMVLNADSLDAAIDASTNIAEFLLPPLAIAANSHYEPPRVLIGYHADQDNQEHRLSFNMVYSTLDPEWTGYRDLHPAASLRLVEKLLNHNDLEILHRSMVHYNDAVSFWTPGQHVRSVEAVFLAAESATPAALREHIRTSGKSESELVTEWGDRVHRVTCKHCHKSWVRPGDIAAAARAEIVFEGRRKLYRQAKDVSEGLEHSFKGFHELRTLAAVCRDDAAKVVRKSILRASSLESDWLTLLTEPPFQDPVRRDVVQQGYRMTLVGPHERLAPPGFSHPVLTATLQLKDVKHNPDGSGTNEGTSELHVVFGEGVFAKDISVHVSDRAKSLTVSDTVVHRSGQESAPESGQEPAPEG